MTSSPFGGSNDCGATTTEAVATPALIRPPTGRSNSLSAFSHCRQASIDATLRLAYMYRLPPDFCPDQSSLNPSALSRGDRLQGSADACKPSVCPLPQQQPDAQKQQSNTWFNLLSRRSNAGSGQQQEQRQRRGRRYRRWRQTPHQQLHRSTVRWHPSSPGQATTTDTRAASVDSLLDPLCGQVEVRLSNRWSFDIFALQRRCSGQLVCSIGMRLFEEHDLFRKLPLHRMTVLATLKAIESAYWNHNPYHTALHAADVTQAMHCFLTQPKLYELLSPSEVLGSLLAALCHDADHPGVNQSYLERTNHHLVSLYSSASVLERHHIRFGLSILHQSGLAHSLGTDTWRTVRDYMAQLIQATDMAHQGTYRSKFTKLVEAQAVNPGYGFSSEDRILILQMALKCADISNPCRPWQICFEWARRVCQEFFCQGDVERCRWSLVPASPMDRNQSTIPGIQVGFIKSLVTPLVTVWCEFFNTPLTNQMLASLTRNYDRWSQLCRNEAAAEGCTKAAVGSGNGTALDCQKPRVGKQRKLNCALLAGAGLRSNVRRCCDDDDAPKDGAKIRQQKPPVQVKTVSPGRQETISGLAVAAQSGGPGKQLSEWKAIVGGDGRPQTTTFVITTSSCPRRHSLPETQGAIRKTFSLSLFKRTNPPPSSVFLVDVRASTESTAVAAEKQLRTASVNILHSLVEEIASRQQQERELLQRAGTKEKQSLVYTGPDLASLRQLLLRRLSPAATARPEVAAFPLSWHVAKPCAAASRLPVFATTTVIGGTAAAAFEKRRNSAPLINH